MMMLGIGSMGDFQWKLMLTSWDCMARSAPIFPCMTIVCLFGIGIRLRARARALRAHEETKVKYRRFRHWASVRRQ